MKVKLIRHCFEDRPDWPIAEETVPLGTVYEVLGYHKEATIHNMLLGETRQIEVYFLDGNGGRGWMPCECFEVIKEDDQTFSMIFPEG